jgi:hypothetical protein
MTMANPNPDTRRAEKSFIMAALAYGHSVKKVGKRGASKARRRLDKAIVRAAARDTGESK